MKLNIQPGFCGLYTPHVQVISEVTITERYVRWNFFKFCFVIRIVYFEEYNNDLIYIVKLLVWLS